MNYWANYYANARIITGIYKEGVLSMDIVDIDKKEPLYSSSVATIMEPGCDYAVGRIIGEISIIVRFAVYKRERAACAQQQRRKQ